jgi:hypothetical protein
MSVFAENVRQDIDQYGVSVIHVGDVDPPFAYTVGLWQAHKHPELIVFGLPGQVMWNLLNAIAKLVKEGQRFTDKTVLQGFGGKFGVTVAPADSKYLDAYFGFGLGFYEETFPIAQVLWPDSNGHFPGEANFDAAYAEIQPVLA